MAAYSSNYSFAQPPPAPGAPPQQQQQYGQQQQWGQPQQQQHQQQFGGSYNFGQAQSQSQYGQASPYNNQQQMYASAPTRMAPRRSLSYGSGKAAQEQSRSLVSFDPYASAPPPQQQQQQEPYNNYSVSTPTNGGGYGYGQAPPAYPMEQMTTSPYGQQQHQQQPQYDQSTVSDISMFTNAPPAPAPSNNQETSMVPAGEGGENGDFSEGSVDPAVLAEQERIWQDIQDRRRMERIRADNGVPNPRAIIPHRGHGLATRVTPARTRSMPHRNEGSRAQDNSLARGGVAVLDPKKDLRKQTRKMKTASGAVGGAVVGGLVLGPVGVVLGAGGGSYVSNKVAKSRDKRKQAEFEQRNFQKGASQSVAAKGSGSFV